MAVRGEEQTDVVSDLSQRRSSHKLMWRAKSKIINNFSSRQFYQHLSALAALYGVNLRGNKSRSRPAAVVRALTHSLYFGPAHPAVGHHHQNSGQFYATKLTAADP